jgi:hypothetical protein
MFVEQLVHDLLAIAEARPLESSEGIREVDELHADLILIDERKGTAVAISKGLDVTGTRVSARVMAARCPAPSGWSTGSSIALTGVTSAQSGSTATQLRTTGGAVGWQSSWYTASGTNTFPNKSRQKIDVTDG